MDKFGFSSYTIEDRSYVSGAKREILRLVKNSGFSALQAGEIDIIVSELCSNLIKHTTDGGELLFRICKEDDDEQAFEIFSIDNGPGTNDIQRMIKDGISSSNTLGQGLGAISRLSDIFQIYSLAGWGTVAYSKKFTKEPDAGIKSPLDLKIIQESIPGEKVCGDGYHIRHLAKETQIFVGDGLGHGQYAHEAINEAIEAFKICPERRPINILRYIHEKVKKTRGLVGTVAVLNHKKKEWLIGGIGNIATRIYQGLEYKTYMPYNGIIGLNILNTMKENEVPAERFQTIVMCSDGIKTKWELTKYPALLKYDPAIMAACIFKDHARKTDDMTVLVGKLNSLE